MGKTRDFLNQLSGSILDHRIERNQLITKYCDSPNLEKYYRHQIDALDQKYEEKFRGLIATHITYLEEKDPYGREPLWGASAKKELMNKVQQDLDPYAGHEFIQKLSVEVDKLQQNPLIDQPRWAKLHMDNVFHFFKSMFSNKTAHSENHKQQPLKPPKR